MSNTIQSLLNLSSIPELDIEAQSMNQVPIVFPSQLVYSPIIRPIKSRLIDQNKIIKFKFRDEGKRVKKICI